jgi:glycosyltransferase involved in cell wall biosynthesis
VEVSEISSREQTDLDADLSRLAAPRQDLHVVQEPKPSVPEVSVVIPCLNESKTIVNLLEKLADQYDRKHYEIVIVDGMSSDGTRQLIAQFIEQHPGLPVRLVDNPAKHIPIALNLGIAAAQGDIIVRMDAHSIPSPNYVRQCVASLKNGQATIVGMPWQIVPGAETLAAKAIALASAHPFGVGGVEYRRAMPGPAAFVDTVPFGVFRRTTWRRLGGFNETLLSNEDYDFNYRARRAGGGILLDRSGYCTYFARATFSSLARQYFRYGGWKLEMLRLHPESLRWRQLAAPALVLLLVLLTGLSVYSAPARVLLGLLGCSYLALAVFFGSVVSWKTKELRLAPAVASAFAVMHLCWGASFLWRLLSLIGRTKG